MLKALLIDTDQEFLEGIAEVVVDDDTIDVQTAEDLEAASESADVVVFGPSVEVEEAVERAAEIAEASPATGLVLVTGDVTADMLRAAMRSGIRDVLSTEDTFGDVVKAIRETHRASLRLRRDDEGMAASESRRGKVVTVFSTKGGVGKTVVATNLAVALAKAGKRTILLDLDLQFGDTGIMLQLKPMRTIFDAMLQYDRLDEEMLGGFLTEHSSGLQVLLAPVHPEDAETITPSRVGRIIGLLQDMADVVVVDTPGAFNDIVLAALDRSDEVYALATMDVASIKNTRISLQKLAQLGYGNERVRIVLNRADSKVWIEAGEVESAIESEIVAKIPSDRLVPRSVNKGVPVVDDSPKSAVAKSLTALAEMIALRNGEVGSHVAEG
jgi:pilus assembly protein CpaE